CATARRAAGPEPPHGAAARTGRRARLRRARRRRRPRARRPRTRTRAGASPAPRRRAPPSRARADRARPRSSPREGALPSPRAHPRPRRRRRLRRRRRRGGRGRTRSGACPPRPREALRARGTPEAAASPSGLEVRRRAGRSSGGTLAATAKGDQVADTTLTWLGHASFRLDTADGKRIYVDPFLHGNPKCPESEQDPDRADVIALTHGHGDHVGDTVDIAKKTGATVVAPVELAGWLQGKQGLENVLDPNKGGSVEVDGTRFTMTNAFHSSSNDDGDYTGEPCGIVVTTSDGKTIYFAGDTCVFGDMQLIGRLYSPDVAV